MYLNLKMITNNGVTQMFNHEALDFEVEKFHLFHFGEKGHTHSQYRVHESIGVGIRRKDTKQALGIVSEN